MARCRLTRNASAGLNLSVTADAVPPPLTRGGFGISVNLISSPEAPLQGELSSDSETERLFLQFKNQTPYFRVFRRMPGPMVVAMVALLK